MLLNPTVYQASESVMINQKGQFFVVFFYLSHLIGAFFLRKLRYCVHCNEISCFLAIKEKVSSYVPESTCFSSTCNHFFSLVRVNQYTNLSKRKILTNAFFDSQYKYCPLVWICYSQWKIDSLHERYQRIIYND